MDIKMTTRLAMLATALFLSACFTGRANDSELYADRAINLGWIAGALQGLVDFGNPADGLTGEALIIEATKDNPRLLDPLAEFYVIGRTVGDYSSVLMCDGERKRALAEDAGCTSTKLDARLWDKSPSIPCAFQLDIVAICSGK